ncbi:MAG: Nif3-like dinuclear metal center hexameric protein [Gemmatimonadetes bacterium]|nr:Nif3-like dinuclear metal center hexameric protein [Gemmatimonadota bacterium]
MNHISRREFGALLASGVVTGRFAAPLAYTEHATAVTAADIIERIRRNIGVNWRAETVDNIKAGDPSTVITGVVTTAMATMGVLQRARETGANLVITSEPTFYGRADSRTPPARPGLAAVPGAAPTATPPRADAVYAAKNAFIDHNRMVIFRLSDHWRMRSPDPFMQGLADTMRWGRYAVGADASRYDIPAVSLEAFASRVKHQLGARGGVRVVGDPRTRVRRVGLLPGSTPITAALRAMPVADVVVAGEVREWESVEYARDLAARESKGLVLVGRVVSEDPGMALCARWLGTLVPEVPVRHVAAGDPYWSPAA